MSDVQIVKHKVGKVTFEVLTKPGTVLKFRKGLIGSIDNVLMTDDVRFSSVCSVSVIFR
jgi:ribosome maturation protein Sdo1